MATGSRFRRREAANGEVLDSKKNPALALFFGVYRYTINLSLPENFRMIG